MPATPRCSLRPDLRCSVLPRKLCPGGPGQAAGASSALGGLGGDSKEPIKIDADKLDVVDKENKAVFSGNVVAVQGETTVRCTVMTVLYEAAAARAEPPVVRRRRPRQPRRRPPQRRGRAMTARSSASCARAR
jgi:hypothetical protein